MNYDIRDLSLAGRGQQRIAWAARLMPVLRQVQGGQTVETRQRIVQENQVRRAFSQFAEEIGLRFDSGE